MAGFNARGEPIGRSGPTSGIPEAVGVLGLGEAGAAIAADLVALGVRVLGWDPDPARTVAGVAIVSSAGDAAAATIVVSVNSQAAAVRAARAVQAVLTPGHLYADMNTTSTAVKRSVAAIVAPTGATFVDVALLAPVPLGGIRTRCLASGPGADRFAAAFGPLGMPVEVLGGEPGDAAGRKLLRSVVMKGIAAAIVESLAAARSAGCEDWLRAEVEAILAGADAGLVERLVTGSAVHAVRRTAEMEAAAALEIELGVEPHVAAAAASVLRALADART
ncbi:MAG TPA: DUF1932 domain-containing protein [Gaiellales bacterium]